MEKIIVCDQVVPRCKLFGQRASPVSNLQHWKLTYKTAQTNHRAFLWRLTYKSFWKEMFIQNFWRSDVIHNLYNLFIPWNTSLGVEHKECSDQKMQIQSIIYWI